MNLTWHWHDNPDWIVRKCRRSDCEIWFRTKAKQRRYCNHHSKGVRLAGQNVDYEEFIPQKSS